MPPTPPEYLPAYSAVGSGGMQVSQLPPYVAHPGMRMRHDKRGYEYLEPYDQAPPAFAPAPPMIYHQPPAYPGAPAPGIGHQNHMYGAPIGAPVLPPIRMPDRSVLDDAVAQHQQHQQHQQQQQQQHHHQDRLPRPEQPKEEKPVGGVSAKLDYEMDQMAEYVAEMSQGMYALYVSRICLADIDIIRSVLPGSPVPPAFRKFVSQILSSTRLPCSTILLGLYYLNTRITMLSANGQYNQSNKSSGSQVYRMLTVSLLLASKFLDDNTFQNRSWSEVSSISVAELNALEIEWLVAIKWKLMLGPDEQKGFAVWQDHWDAWRNRASSSKAPTVPKLAPLDTNLQRQQQSKIFPTTPLYPSHYTGPPVSGMSVDPQHAQTQSAHLTPSLFDQGPWSYGRSNTERSPPSAPETGPNTPEYFGWSPFHLPSHAPPQYTMRPVPTSNHSSHISSQPPSYHHTPYAQYYSHHTTWHGAGCACAYCGRSNESYFMASGFGPQTVVG
ncbi:hypothetical protein GP486_007824 [Trichoglossum hirsutum]|uniref:Uncharacterized protein n=1 Tax=Trichoglossum hirsutum TaxID=265104 RepID=A0A9P8L6M0_9PEZI|nr:hypothetical protein GP486_007824 [Trichoglossum hirsutum]